MPQKSGPNSRVDGRTIQNTSHSTLRRTMMITPRLCLDYAEHEPHHRPPLLIQASALEVDSEDGEPEICGLRRRIEVIEELASIKAVNPELTYVDLHRPCFRHGAHAVQLDRRLYRHHRQ